MMPELDESSIHYVPHEKMEIVPKKRKTLLSKKKKGPTKLEIDEVRRRWAAGVIQRNWALFVLKRPMRVERANDWE